eukprot:TRINITY_DN1081_c0_g1_i1.p1 TRINITY_DN1081_c0_g1~~TRINITY_DN1081_c0_g1_i1.p1  ORF type:complete len:614 (-),score=145.21 TRINITY_DN1081_c0_g1_i1:148-1989(-)
MSLSPEDAKHVDSDGSPLPHSLRPQPGYHQVPRIRPPPLLRLAALQSQSLSQQPTEASTTSGGRQVVDTAPHYEDGEEEEEEEERGRRGDGGDGGLSFTISAHGTPTTPQPKTSTGRPPLKKTLSLRSRALLSHKSISARLQVHPKKFKFPEDVSEDELAGMIYHMIQTDPSMDEFDPTVHPRNALLVHHLFHKIFFFVKGSTSSALLLLKAKEEMTGVSPRHRRYLCAEMRKFVSRTLDREMEIMIPEDRSLKTPPLYGSSVSTGGRLVQEDMIATYPFASEIFSGGNLLRGSSLYCLFDGHSGSSAATYAQMHLGYRIYRNLQDNIPRRESGEFDGEQLVESLKSAFRMVDRFFSELSGYDESGTTALSVLVHGRHVYVAFVGDSMACWMTEKTSGVIGEAHIPNRPDERSRVVSQGGSVVMFGTWRVDGTLGISRSIGDRRLSTLVIAEPEVIRQEIDVMLNQKTDTDYTGMKSADVYRRDSFLDMSDRDSLVKAQETLGLADFHDDDDSMFQSFGSSMSDDLSSNAPSHGWIIMASDGLWDVCTPEDVREFIVAQDKECAWLSDQEALSAMAKRITTHAEEKKSKDNISVILIPLRYNGISLTRIDQSD